MNSMTQRLVSNLAENVDSSDLQEGIMKFVEKKIFPELEEIKERAIDDDDAQAAREQYQSLSPEEREEMFHGVLGDIIGILFEIRVRPETGLKEAKRMLRDPYTMEAVLLIFDHPDVSDQEREEMKDFVAHHIKALGVAIAPEMYERDEVLQVAEDFGVNKELVEHYDEQYDIDDPDEIPAPAED